MFAPHVYTESHDFPRKQADASARPAAVEAVLEAPGQPLPGPERALFEARFSHDFSGVRVHTGATADAAVRSVGAAAFTHGRNIVFGAGRYNSRSPAGRHLLAHELTHVLQQSCMAGPRPIQRQSVPLPDYAQKGDTCDPASLATALILRDKESAGAGEPNANIVGVCEAALIYMARNRAALVAKYSKGGADGSKQFETNTGALLALRNRMRGPGSAVSEAEYQALAAILSEFGDDVQSVLRALGLNAPSSPGMKDTLADIFADPALGALKPGETAQILWYTDVGRKDSSGKDLGASPQPHAFLIGRGKSGAWFLSNQGDRPPLHLEAGALADLFAELKKAKAAGRTGLSTDPSLHRIALTGTGINLIGPQDYSQPFRALVPPGTFLAEVDETAVCCGERLHAWDFVGTAHSDTQIDALFAASGTGHGFLVLEVPAGAFSVFKTNPVTDKKNAGAGKIDQGDSAGGLLTRSTILLHAWLKLRTASDTSASGKGFQVF